MKRNLPLSANQIPKCPPHHWYIEGDGQAHCKKCPATKIFKEKIRRFGAENQDIIDERKMKVLLDK